MLGYKWWRYTINLDEFLATSPTHEKDKVRRRVHFNDVWQVSTKDPKVFRVKCLVTIKTRLKFGSHWEFVQRVREVLKKNPLPTKIKDAVDHVKEGFGFPKDTDKFDLLTALLYTRATQVVNLDTVVHLELMANYLAKKQYGKEMFTRPAGRHTEQVHYYKDLLTTGTALPVTPVIETPEPVAAGVTQEEEKKVIEKIKRKSVMSISEEKVTFD